MSILNLPFAGLELGFAVTLACSLLLVLTTRWHGRYSLDATHGVQKFHITPTPRVGGAAIMLGLWLSLGVLTPEQQDLLLPVLVAAMPAFVFGLAEDLTRNVSVRARLLATMASGVCCWGLTGVTLLRIGVEPLDMLLSWLPVSVLFTAFAVGGVANAVNIIDGFNGLASGTVLIGMAALGVLAQDAGDATLAQLCFTVCAVTAGFFVVNFPFGKLFLGDGGAYLLGFLLAWLSVMLVYRNPGVSPWAPLLACAYPIFETVFTIVRRLWCRRHPGHPDSWHLHSLVKTAVAARYFRALPAPLRNACVSPFSWAVALVPAMMAVRFANVPEALLQGVLASFLLYLSVYAFVVSAWWARRRRMQRPLQVPLADISLEPGNSSFIGRGL
ncbi:MraY family glycosyltransferase [Massilia yuzhufengensis]|uniref:UDP-N-acetylmuramyl pentapeptide phosphotransferase/UDP-N-acetylglucosamine-1-phosphate transferase n=1 Tax=Massilia yuzhufengensis TaxID=1164594 RepID=A0A1I1MI67_9BURK|nr:glycosyltransferase [Massilia yuzhufengensis]SFC84542.1 UDP-N-acetylmuramyl pentapeptide phosphotransferase/UDP-N-acetylglucosamine-1-phosphate transferase [Massilia yuzhufengensis]